MSHREYAAELEHRVDAIITEGVRDPETGHGDEDELLVSLVRSYCPKWVVREVERLAAADFPRWYS